MKPLRFGSVAYRSCNTGQIMILSVLALGGTILGVTTIAGLLMAYQIRQATDFAFSAKAIFAADGGLEWGLYNFYCTTDPAKTPCPLPAPAFSNGASFAVQCANASGDFSDCDDLASATVLRSVGTAGEASRAFEIAL